MIAKHELRQLNKPDGLSVESLNISNSPKTNNASNRSSYTANESDESNRAKSTKVLTAIKAKTTSKVKDLIERNSGKFFDDSDDRHNGFAIENTRNDPAFHPASAKQHQLDHVRKDGPLNRAKANLEETAETLAHPRKSIIHKVKKVAAGKISSVQKPHSLPITGVELLEAYDAYDQSESSRSSDEALEDYGASESTQDALKKKVRLEKLAAQRESMRVAWVTRHTDRVRVVPQDSFAFPSKEDFMHRDPQGNVMRFKWEKYIGNILLWYTQDWSAQYIDDFETLPFDMETLRNHAERLVMGSAPWQVWLMEVRSIYRWQDPWRTGCWFALFAILWYTQHMMAFFWTCIIYYTVRNRLYPSSMNHLRASIQRSVNRETAAFQFGEFVDRHGRDSWVDPLIEQVGPHVQLQLGDLANMLEVLANFYSWRSPKKTLASLSFFSACLAVSLFADMEFCMKIFWFITGGSFFLCWPISSIYPRYRYLVSPFKWVLWDIPTHTEWSFQYLRRHCQDSREAMIVQQVEQRYKSEAEEPTLQRYDGRLDQPHPHIELDGVGQNSSDSVNSEDFHSAGSSSSLLAGSDFLSYRTRWEGISGRLAIGPHGLRFTRSVKRQELWYLPYIKIEEMRKFRGAARSSAKHQGVLTKRVLELKEIDGRSYTLELRGDRDEAFNYIIGFSGLRWQSLQPAPQTETSKT